MNHRQKIDSREAGFTIIELLVVLAIGAILFGLTSINLGKAQSTASLSSVKSTLIADLRNQQILAMSGDKGSTNSQQIEGIYIQPTSYTLFSGSSYNSIDPYNYTVQTDPVSLTTTIPGSVIMFNKGDGSVINFNSSNNSINLSQSGTTRTITMNQFGVTTTK